MLKMTVWDDLNISYSVELKGFTNPLPKICVMKENKVILNDTAYSFKPTLKSLGFSEENIDTIINMVTNIIFCVNPKNTVFEIPAFLTFNNCFNSINVYKVIDEKTCINTKNNGIYKYIDITDYESIQQFHIWYANKLDSII